MTAAPKKILVVDDEEALRLVLASELKSSGYDVYAFDLKNDAYDWVIQNKPDLILSDIKAPVMDGFQFLRWLRENPFTKNVPFVFVTGFADLKNAIEAKRLGAADFVSKPYDLVDLLQTIERVLTAEWYENIYPKAASLQESAASGTLKFVEWSKLRELFCRLIGESPERAAVLEEGRQWNIFTVVDNPDGIIAVMFLRPLDIDTISMQDIVYFREMLTDRGLDRGIMMGFFKVDSSLQTFAHFLGIQLVDGTATNNLLGSVVSEKEPGANESLLARMGIRIGRFEDSKPFLGFVSQIKDEIELCIGKLLHFKIPTDNESRDQLTANARLEFMNDYFLRFNEESDGSTVLVPSGLILKTLFKLWREGALKKAALNTDSVSREYLFQLLSHLPSLDCTEDEIRLRPGKRTFTEHQ